MTNLYRNPGCSDRKMASLHRNGYGSSVPEAPILVPRGPFSVRDREESVPPDAETDDERVTLHLEKARRRFTQGEEPSTRYQFAVLGREAIPEDPANDGDEDDDWRSR